MYQYRTQEELDKALPGTVVLDADNDVYRKSETLDHDGKLISVWWQAGPQGRFRTVALPARKLVVAGTIQ